jgi:hypothetical protein
MDHDLEQPSIQSLLRRPTDPSYLSRVLYGKLPGGPGNVAPILAHSGGQVTIQLSARQPGQLQRVVGRRTFKTP